MTLNEIPREQVATEWDMGWFCWKCENLISWKTKAFMINNKPYCCECAKKYVKNYKSLLTNNKIYVIINTTNDERT